MMKRLKKMIDSEDIEKGSPYLLPDRFSPDLLDFGYIKLLKWGQNNRDMHLDCSNYFSTQKGREAYAEWERIKG